MRVTLLLSALFVLAFALEAERTRAHEVFPMSPLIQVDPVSAPLCSPLD